MYTQQVGNLPVISMIVPDEFATDEAIKLAYDKLVNVIMHKGHIDICVSDPISRQDWDIIDNVKEQLGFTRVHSTSRQMHRLSATNRVIVDDMVRQARRQLSTIHKQLQQLLQLVYKRRPELLDFCEVVVERKLTEQDKKKVKDACNKL